MVRAAVLNSSPCATPLCTFRMFLLSLQTFVLFERKCPAIFRHDRGLELRTAGLESRTRNSKVVSSSLQELEVGGVNVQRSLHSQYHN